MAIGPKGNQYAIAALKDRRAHLAGEIGLLKRQIAWRTEQLAGIDATLALFLPGIDPKTIPAKKAYKRIHLFKQGELARSVLDALRECGKPVQLEDVITATLGVLGMARVHRPAMGHRVRASLAYLEKRGRVRKSGHHLSARWALAD
jgi:hypothetical protein